MSVGSLRPENDSDPPRIQGSLRPNRTNPTGHPLLHIESSLFVDGVDQDTWPSTLLEAV